MAAFYFRFCQVIPLLYYIICKVLALLYVKYKRNILHFMLLKSHIRPIFIC